MTTQNLVSKTCFVMILFIQTQASAQWLCREASSQRLGSTITTCGTASAKTENEARTLSREHAVEEFKRVCNLSKDCRGFDYTVLPKRTECMLSTKGFTCYRGMEFEILTVKMDHLEVDPSDIQAEINDHNQKIKDLEAQAETVRKERNLAREEVLAHQDLANETGKDVIYLNDSFKNSLKTDLKYWSGSLTKDQDTEIFFDFTYEHRPTTWLGLQGTLGIGSGQFKNTSTDTQMETGTSNTSKHADGDMSLIDMNVAVLGYTGFHGIYVKAEVGQVTGTSKSYDATYNNLGTASVVKTTNTNIQQAYTGAEVGFDSRDSRSHWGVFGEVGVRNASQIGVVGSVGVNFGF